MFLPSDLQQALVHSVVEKQIADNPYAIDRITGKTETGGLGILGSVAQTITAAGVTQIVTAWTEAYFQKVAAAVPATGVITTTTGTTFTINCEGVVQRAANSGGKFKLTLVSSKDGILATKEIVGTPHNTTEFALAFTGALTAAANLISLNISGDTITDEVYNISNAALFLESAG